MKTGTTTSEARQGLTCSDLFCLWQFKNGHGGEWKTSCGALYDADDFGCSSIRKCPNCGKKTTTDPFK